MARKSIPDFKEQTGPELQTGNGLLAALTRKKLFFNILIPQSKMFRYFSLGFACCFHCAYFWKQHLRMCIFFSGHKFTP